MVKPYTYLLHHIPTNTWYYGVRWGNVKLGLTPEQDYWKRYYSRSKKVDLLRKQYGNDSFEFEIRKTFESVNKAKKWECKVLRRMKVLKKPNLWLNRTDNEIISTPIVISPAP